MGSPYASEETIKKVKKAIRHLPNCTVVYPHLIKSLTGIDHNQAKAALRKIAPAPNRFVDIGGESKLTRTYKPVMRLGIIRTLEDDRWFYDPPNDEWLPPFPELHELMRIWTPRIHRLFHQ